MSKPLSTSVDVPADVETTWQALTGPSWPQAQDARLHDDSRLVSTAATPEGGAVVVVSRRLPDAIPGALKKFTPADGRVTQTDSWGPLVDGVRRGTWAVMPASPAAIRGEMTIEPTAAGSRYTVTGTVQVRVPLVGGKLEGYVAPLIEKLVGTQAEVLRDQVS